MHCGNKNAIAKDRTKFNFQFDITSDSESANNTSSQRV